MCRGRLWERRCESGTPRLGTETVCVAPTTCDSIITQALTSDLLSFQWTTIPGSLPPSPMSTSTPQIQTSYAAYVGEYSVQVGSWLFTSLFAVCPS
jgi:hypothetical protein